jgi:regulatory protein
VDESTREEVRERAIRLLARREHAVRELAQKLRQRGYPSETVAAVTDELRAEGLLSDERFAEEFVRSRRGQGFGPLRIRADLGRRGVDDGIATAFLEDDETNWLSQAASVREKRFGTALPPDGREWQRQARYLVNRGYTRDQIRRVLGGSEFE